MVLWGVWQQLKCRQRTLRQGSFGRLPGPAAAARWRMLSILQLLPHAAPRCPLASGPPASWRPWQRCPATSRGLGGEQRPPGSMQWDTEHLVEVQRQQPAPAGEGNPCCRRRLHCHCTGSAAAHIAWCACALPLLMRFIIALLSWHRSGPALSEGRRQPSDHGGCSSS